MGGVRPTGRTLLKKKTIEGGLTSRIALRNVSICPSFRPIFTLPFSTLVLGGLVCNKTVPRITQAR